MDGKISDEIHKWCAFNEDTIIDNDDCDELRALADRIDAEMVELPLSADRKIWTGREECFWIEARGGAWSRHSILSLDLIDGSRWYVRDTGGLGYEAGAAWSERPDSFERIADELDNFADANYASGLLKQGIKDFSDRIRKLAKEGE